MLPNISPPEITKWNVCVGASLGWEKLNLFLLCGMLAVTKIFLDTFIQRGVTMGSTTLLQKKNYQANCKGFKKN